MRRRSERKRFARLFAAPLLDIGTLTRLTVEERTILLAVIDGCLSNPNRQYRTPDGSILVLLNPDEPTYTLLRASDGVLLLPRYRLQREKMERIPV